MAAKPGATPNWNTDGTNRTTPSAGELAAGYAVNQVPSSSKLNWWMNTVYQWIQYFADQVFSGGLTSTGAAPNGSGVTGVGVGTGAGLLGKGAGAASPTPVADGVVGVVSALASGTDEAAAVRGFGRSGAVGMLGRGNSSLINAGNNIGVYGEGEAGTFGGAGVYGVGGLGTSGGGYGGVFVGNAYKAPIHITVQGAAPSFPVEGDLYYDLTTHKLRVRTDTAWVDLH